MEIKLSTAIITNTDRYEKNIYTENMIDMHHIEEIERMRDANESEEEKFIKRDIYEVDSHIWLFNIFSDIYYNIGIAKREIDNFEDDEYRKSLFIESENFKYLLIIKYHLEKEISLLEELEGTNNEYLEEIYKEYLENESLERENREKFIKYIRDKILEVTKISKEGLEANFIFPYERYKSFIVSFINNPYTQGNIDKFLIFLNSMEAGKIGKEIYIIYIMLLIKDIKINIDHHMNFKERYSEIFKKYEDVINSIDSEILTKERNMCSMHMTRYNPYKNYKPNMTYKRIVKLFAQDIDLKYDGLSKNTKEKMETCCFASLVIEGSILWFSVSGCTFKTEFKKVVIDLLQHEFGIDEKNILFESDEVTYYLKTNDIISYKDYIVFNNDTGNKSDKKKIFKLKLPFRKENNTYNLSRMFSCCERKFIPILQKYSFKNYYINIKWKKCYMCNRAFTSNGIDKKRVKEYKNYKDYDKKVIDNIDKAGGIVYQYIIKR